jgi:hypothetical protein
MRELYLIGGIWVEVCLAKVQIWISGSNANLIRGIRRERFEISELKRSVVIDEHGDGSTHMGDINAHFYGVPSSDMSPVIVKLEGICNSARRQTWGHSKAQKSGVGERDQREGIPEFIGPGHCATKGIAPILKIIPPVRRAKLIRRVHPEETRPAEIVALRQLEAVCRIPRSGCSVAIGR